MSEQENQTPLNPEAWEGDPDELVDYVDQLTLDSDGELCDQLFATKYQAFTTGVYLESRKADSERTGQ